MTTLAYHDLSRFREKNLDKKIVFCSGSFDLFHAGHVIFFEDCKNLGDVLVVAVGPDHDIQANKGSGRPILNEHARLKIVDSLKSVDYSFISRPTAKGAHWLTPIEEILGALKPDVWAVNGDGGEMEHRQELALRFGVLLVVLNRTAPPEYEGLSTTSLLKKIRDLS